MYQTNRAFYEIGQCLRVGGGSFVSGTNPKKGLVWTDGQDPEVMGRFWYKTLLTFICRMYPVQVKELICTRNLDPESTEKTSTR